MSNSPANNSLLYKAGVYVARLDQARVLQELWGSHPLTQLSEHPMCVSLPAGRAMWARLMCSHTHLESFFLRHLISLFLNWKILASTTSVKVATRDLDRRLIIWKLKSYHLHFRPLVRTFWLPKFHYPGLFPLNVCKSGKTSPTLFQYRLQPEALGPCPSGFIPGISEA